MLKRAMSCTACSGPGSNYCFIVTAQPQLTNQNAEKQSYLRNYTKLNDSWGPNVLSTERTLLKCYITDFSLSFNIAIFFTPPSPVILVLWRFLSPVFLVVLLTLLKNLRQCLLKDYNLSNLLKNAEKQNNEGILTKARWGTFTVTKLSKNVFSILSNTGMLEFCLFSFN